MSRDTVLIKHAGRQGCIFVGKQITVSGAACYLQPGEEVEIKRSELRRIIGDPIVELDEHGEAVVYEAAPTKRAPLPPPPPPKTATVTGGK